MSHRRWLKLEASQWVKDGIITEETEKTLAARYKKRDFTGYKELFFVLALVCILGGLFFLGAGLWESLTQDERFALALGPLVLSFLFFLATVLLDRRIPDQPVRKRVSISGPMAEEAFSGNGMSDSSVTKAQADRIGRKAQVLGILSGETRMVPSGTYHHSIPAFVREAAATIHGLCLLGAFWMVGDSFKLTNDLYTGLAYAAFLLLILAHVSSSAGLSILYMASAVGVFYTAPAGGWPVWVSWIYMILALHLLVDMLREHRDRSVICFSWFWAAGMLLLIFWSAGALLWQTLFFSLLAALTWMAGGIFRSYGLAAEALRFFGGIAVFAVLLEGSYGSVWADISGSYALWILFLLFLLADGVLLFRIALRKEWLSMLAGLTPFVMAGAAVTAIFETTGALPAMIISVYCAVLAAGVIARGLQTDRALQRLSGMGLLAADGIIRVIDSTLTLAQRGTFFLVVGAAAALIAFLLYRPSGRKKTGRKKNSAVQSAETEGKDEE